MIKPKKLCFGTAGIPLSTPSPSTLSGISHVKKLGLDSMELEFVRSINISKEKAPLVKETAKKENILLTCHGQYFINLNSLDPQKVAISKSRIFQAAKRAYECGAYSMTFHAAYYMKEPPSKVYPKVKRRMKKVVNMLKEHSIEIWVRPELTGKGSQWGSLKELIKLSQEVEYVLPCIDFAHQHARTGKYNSYIEFSKMLEAIEDGLGKEALRNMHIHTAGIEYTEKGERRHLNLKDSDMNYRELVKAWKDFKIKGAVTCESPNIEKDALLLKKTYNKI